MHSIYGRYTPVKGELKIFCLPPYRQGLNAGAGAGLSWSGGQFFYFHPQEMEQPDQQALFRIFADFAGEFHSLEH